MVLSTEPLVPGEDRWGICRQKWWQGELQWVWLMGRSCLKHVIKMFRCLPNLRSCSLKKYGVRMEWCCGAIWNCGRSCSQDDLNTESIIVIYKKCILVRITNLSPEMKYVICDHVLVLFRPHHSVSYQSLPLPLQKPQTSSSASGHFFCQLAATALKGMCKRDSATEPPSANQDVGCVQGCWSGSDVAWSRGVELEGRTCKTFECFTQQMCEE